MAGLFDREDDVVSQLREQHDVCDVGIEGVLEQARRAARGKQDHGRPRVLADRGHVVRGQGGAARCVQHDLQVAARQRRGALEDVVAPAYELDLGVLRERLSQIGEPVTDTAHKDADGVLAVHFQFVSAHRGGLLPSEDVSLSGGETVRDDAAEAVDVIAAVGGVGDGAQLQVPPLGTGP